MIYEQNLKIYYMYNQGFEGSDRGSRSCNAESHATSAIALALKPARAWRVATLILDNVVAV